MLVFTASLLSVDAETCVSLVCKVLFYRFVLGLFLFFRLHHRPPTNQPGLSSDGM